MASVESILLYTADRLLGLLFLIAALPLILIVASIVFVLSRRNPFILHCRVGRNGQAVRVIKIRTMWGGVENESEPTVPVLKSEHDPRVTSAFARFCRRHSVDELPQLLHVAGGQMSLVGPVP